MWKNIVFFDEKVSNDFENKHIVRPWFYQIVFNIIIVKNKSYSIIVVGLIFYLSSIISLIFDTITSTATSCLLSFGMMMSAYLFVGLIKEWYIGLTVVKYWSITFSNERPLSFISLNNLLINLISSSDSTNNLISAKSLILSSSKIRIPSRIITLVGFICLVIWLLVWILKSYVV